MTCETFPCIVITSALRDPREDEEQEDEEQEEVSSTVRVRTSPRSVTRRRTSGGRRTRPTRRPPSGSRAREGEDERRVGEKNSAELYRGVM